MRGGKALNAFYAWNLLTPPFLVVIFYFSSLVMSMAYWLDLDWIKEGMLLVLFANHAVVRLSISSNRTMNEVIA
jgi:hypothetical protein